MSPDFFSLSLNLAEYLSRAASGMRERELRAATALFASLADDDNL